MSDTRSRRALDDTVVEFRGPASFQQARLVRRETRLVGLESESPHFIRRFGPDVDLKMLSAAMDALVARHEPLRTSFAVRDDGGIDQLVHRAGPVELPLVQLEGEPDAVREELVARVHEEVLRPFDLVGEPVLRPRLYQYDGKTFLLLVIHHIAFDRWSHAVFVAELSELYRAFCAGEQPNLPALTMQYRDYSAWQLEKWESGGFSAHSDYWRARLADRPPPMRLPADKPREKPGPAPADGLDVAIPTAIADGVWAAAKRMRASESVVLLAAYQLALARWSGVEHVIVGSPVANRPLPETEKLVGLFVNMVPIQARVVPGETFRAFVQRIRNDVFDAYDHQDLFFEQILESVPEAERGDLARVVFGYDDATTGIWDAAPFGEPVNICAGGPVHYDLSMVIQRTAEGITGSIVYPETMFEEHNAQGFLDDFTAILDEVGQDPEMTVDLTRPYGPQRVREGVDR